MRYRPFGSTGWNASALGLGCMRLPTRGPRSEIDEPAAISLVHRAIEGGVNYLDSAYGYHDGASEVLVGKALAGGWRDRVKIATKLPPWSITSAADFQRIFDQQRSRLETDRVDLYLFHGLDRGEWVKIRDLGVLDWAARQQAAGSIGWLGFSFHDSVDAFREIVDAYRWTFAMIQHNYLDEHDQAGSEGLAYAATRGLAVTVMEPLLGGVLAEPPDPVRALWEAAPAKRSPVGWALAWLWNKPEVSVVLSGMSAMAQLEENLRLADEAAVGMLSPAEVQLAAGVAQAWEGLRPIPCTSCNYCMPCPNGVDIPRNLGMYNRAVMYGRMDRGRWWYAEVKAGERAGDCTDCDACQEKCPQKIPISDWMPRIHEALGEKK